MILEPKKIKYVIVFTFPTSICHEMKELDAMILVFIISSFTTAFSPPANKSLWHKGYFELETIEQQKAELSASPPLA